MPAGAAEDFSSPELTSCAECYSVSVPPPALPQWHIKDPGHSAKSADGRLKVNTHTHFDHRSRSGLTMLSRHSVGTNRGNELTRNSSRNNKPAELNHCGLILGLKE